MVAMLIAGTSHGAEKPTPDQWPMFGQNLNNTANGKTSAIGTRNVSRLAPKWTFTTGGDVSARAAVVKDVVYFPDWSGHLYAVKAKNGTALWSKNVLKDYLPDAFSSPPSKVVSRTTPYIDTASNTLYTGTQAGAYMLAINATTGKLKWKTKLDSHPQAVDTQSPVVYKGVLYVGVSSIEELAAADPNYKCCTFRGSVLALNATTGKKLWKTHTTPTGYSGAAVWGSTIVPDPERGVVYATTGNNYSEPTDPAYLACIAAGGTQESCQSPHNHFNSVLALRVKDGSVSWSQRLGSTDDWNTACFIGGVNCPASPGPDFDFGHGVNRFTIQTHKGPKTLIGAGQKSGIYSVFDPANGGKLVWATKVGPGSELGGMQWGAATDGKRIYVGIGNLNREPYTLQPSGQQTNVGSWSALDPATGRILWQTADPSGAMALGPLTVANGVVYAPSTAGGSSKNMFALDAATGTPLWSFASGGTVIAGATVVDKTVYWGSGYSAIPVPGFTPNNKFYAFTVSGR
ncbi:PQQ-binding-like beta-propeller repeat protein [Streptomyces sp. JH14]|uniref:outer membrane protein assembly factor BamB family protein n=1 Tax=Streptomyces sp. JH14 TaxID=2793630 RepID=UPI0023F9CBA6|nr:PQQ-binding-like beta-propeller repeat protein [Streptomyces sp. JH14]MDF6043009.1 PQQ-binding-like beta-propeller repeat protein [Streptomyces sp. JH14]